jgi:CRISPR-associated endonuclease/helicase Cas3
VLLRTWLTLRDLSAVQLPDRMDELIESVYDLDMDIPKALTAIEKTDWEKSLVKYYEDCAKKKTLAQEIQLPPAQKVFTLFGQSLNTKNKLVNEYY